MIFKHLKLLICVLICVLMVIFYHTVQADGEGKTETQDGPISKETASSKMIMPATPASIAGKFVGPVISSGMTTALELRNSFTVHSKENIMIEVIKRFRLKYNVRLLSNDTYFKESINHIYIYGEIMVPKAT